MVLLRNKYTLLFWLIKMPSILHLGERSDTPSNTYISTDILLSECAYFLDLFFFEHSHLRTTWDLANSKYSSWHFLSLSDSPSGVQIIIVSALHYGMMLIVRLFRVFFSEATTSFSSPLSRFWSEWLGFLHRSTGHDSSL